MLSNAHKKIEALGKQISELKARLVTVTTQNRLRAPAPAEGEEGE